MRRARWLAPLEKNNHSATDWSSYAMMEFFLLVQYAHSVYTTEKLAGTVKYLRRSEALIISLFCQSHKYSFLRREPVYRAARPCWLVRCVETLSCAYGGHTGRVIRRRQLLGGRKSSLLGSHVKDEKSSLVDSATTSHFQQ